MKRLILLCALLASTGFAAEQNAEENEQQDIKEPKISLWRLELCKTTKIVLSVQSITAVAMHPYLLNGENMVTEVTVDTTGNNTIRFYYIHPAGGDIRSTSITDHKQLMGVAKQRINREVTHQKDDNALPAVKFPEGAYAHSIEYQVSSLEDLDKIYKSLISVWERSSKKVTNLNISTK